MASNLQEAIAAIAAATEKNGEIMGLVTGVESFADESQATLYEMLGAGNEQTALFHAASNQAGVIKGLVASLGTEMESLMEYLQQLQ